VNYEFHPEAEEELIAEAVRYESEVTELGVGFGGEVNRVIELLIENPTLGTPVDGHLRSFVLRRFPHAILYGAFRDTLFIVAVAHGSRRPGYWRGRT